MKNTTIPSHSTGSRIGHPIIGYNIICPIRPGCRSPHGNQSTGVQFFFVDATHPAILIGHSPMAWVSFESGKQPAASNQFGCLINKTTLWKQTIKRNQASNCHLLATNSAKNSPCCTCRYAHPLLATQPRHEVLAHVVVDSLLLPIDLTPFRWPQWHDGWVVSHIPGTYSWTLGLFAQNPCFR